MIPMRLAGCRNLSSSLPLLFSFPLTSTSFTIIKSATISQFAANMEENGARGSILTAQELRRKRLAAFGKTTISAKPKLDSVARAVVDLCDRDSSDDEKPAAARTTCVDSDDDDAALLQEFYQEKKKRAKRDKAVNDQPLKRQKSSGTLAKRNKKAASSPSSSSSSSSNTTHRFQVATWNIWFGAPNLPAGQPHASARMKAMARHLLRQHDPQNNKPLLAIGFQEVINELAVHLFPLLENQGYQIFRQEGAPYGCAIALYTTGDNACTLLDVSWQPYSDTVMARGFLYARFQLPFSGKQVLFTTTHLESWCGKEYTGAAQRVKQLKQLEAFCSDQLETYSSLQTSIITGDLNWDDERRGATTDAPMANVLTDAWIDSWLSTKTGTRGETGYTYDSKLNPMLGGNLRRRFDRCLVRNTAQGSVESTSTKLVGIEPLVGLYWDKLNTYTRQTREVPTAPSDHFGLVVQMNTTA